jgi:hypothetical protein
MRSSSVSVRLSSWAIPVADFVRARLPDAMERDEMKRRARAVWNSIDGGNDVPHRETQAKASRLYYVARDIQQAQSLGAKAHIVHSVVSYLMAVLARSYGIGVGAR